MWQMKGGIVPAVALLPVADADGATDAVFHFVNGTRAHAAGQDYFGCADAAQWDGVPLMGVASLDGSGYWRLEPLERPYMPWRWWLQ
jgi:hypothetical protein